jgi:hypothetical protein
VLDATGGWSALETVVELPASTGDAALAREARRHFERARALGVGAPVHLGLAALARLDGDGEAVSRHVAAARAADASLPATAPADAPTSAAVPR